MGNDLDVPTLRALVTLGDAAAYLSCSRRHVERLLARGELPRVTDLDQYIADLKSVGR